MLTMLTESRPILMLFVQQVFVPCDHELQSTFHNTVMQSLVDGQADRLSS